MRKLFSLLFALVLMVSFVNAQDSFGPAPYDVNNAKIVTSTEDASALGTRMFNQNMNVTAQFGKSFTEACTITNVGAPLAIAPGFPGGVFYRLGKVYTYNQLSPYQLWEIDTTTGTHTLLGTMSGVTLTNLTGMCYDGTTVYALQSSLSASQIMTLNMTTFALTPIGVSSATCAGGITLMCSYGGTEKSLFAVDIVADNLYRFNKTTGVATLVGPLGFNANFGQDGTCDIRDGQYYIVTVDANAGNALQYRKLDSALGSSTILCTFTAQPSGIAALPPSGPPPPPPPLSRCRNGLNINLLDNQTIQDSVQVALGNGCTVVDVNVRIDTMIHTWDADVTFYLRKGTVGVNIVDNVGGSGDNFINTVLNDSAATPIASGVAPFTGSFRPSNPLTVFNGQSTEGYWKLVATDTAGGDTGFLRAWCVVITFNCPVGGIQTVEIPNYYSLSQNYPNPFNPSTNIKFTMPKGDNVKLVIFDVLGREVRTLVNEYRSSGVYEVSFDASALSSGVYFYRIETGEFNATKRMLLVK